MYSHIMPLKKCVCLAPEIKQNSSILNKTSLNGVVVARRAIMNEEHSGVFIFVFFPENHIN